MNTAKLFQTKVYFTETIPKIKLYKSGKEVLKMKKTQTFLLRHQHLLPALTGLIVFFLLLTVGIALQKQPIYEDTLRLHIRAASDSEYDQELKLLVRDRLTVETARLTENCSTRQQAQQKIEKNLSELYSTAIQTLRENGSYAPVSIQVGEELFNTRTYSTSCGKITLPAGRYPTLSVTIGEGGGHNWWCVLYPSLCLPAATAEKTREALSVYTDDERSLISRGYTIRFWTAEVFTKITALFSGEQIYTR